MLKQHEGYLAGWEKFGRIRLMSCYHVEPSLRKWVRTVHWQFDSTQLGDFTVGSCRDELLQACRGTCIYRGRNSEGTHEQPAHDGPLVTLNSGRWTEAAGKGTWRERRHVAICTFHRPLVEWARTMTATGCCMGHSVLGGKSWRKYSLVIKLPCFCLLCRFWGLLYYSVIRFSQLHAEIMS